MFWVFYEVTDSKTQALDDGILESFFYGEPLGHLVIGDFGNVQCRAGHPIIDVHVSRRGKSLGQDGLALLIDGGAGREFRPLLVCEQDRQQARWSDVLAQARCLSPYILLPGEEVDSGVFL